MIPRPERRTEDRPVEDVGRGQDQRGRQRGEEPQEEPPFPVLLAHEDQKAGQGKHRIGRGTHRAAERDQNAAPHQRCYIDAGARGETRPQDHRPYAEQQIRDLGHRISGQGDEERTEQEHGERQESGQAAAGKVARSGLSRTHRGLAAREEHRRGESGGREPGPVDRAVDVAGDRLKRREEEQGEPRQITGWIQDAVQIESIFPFPQEVVGAERVFKRIGDHEPARSEFRGDVKSKNIQSQGQNGQDEHGTLEFPTHFVDS